MPYILLALVATILIFWLVLKLKEADPKTLQKSVRITLLLILALVILLSALTGRIGLVAAGVLGIVFLLAPQLKTYFKDRSPTYLPKDMTLDEAAQVLGISIDAIEAEIQEAYHRLISKNHPDHGGSKFIAQQLNQARDVLIKQIKEKNDILSKYDYVLIEFGKGFKSLHSIKVSDSL